MKKLFLLFVLTGIISSCMNNMPANDKSAANKAGTQRFYDKVFNAHNVAMADSFCTKDFVDHNPEQSHSGKGIEDLKAELTDFFTAYPDIHITANSMVASGDTVVVMMNMTGTNSGPMMGQPGTNKQININGVDILILKDGKATDRWGFFEEMKMMMQLGMMPDMSAAPDSSKMMNGMQAK